MRISVMGGDGRPVLGVASIPLSEEQLVGREVGRGSGHKVKGLKELDKRVVLEDEEVVDGGVEENVPNLEPVETEKLVVGQRVRQRQGVFLHSTHCAVAFSAQYFFFRKKKTAQYKIEVSAQ